MEAMRLIRSFLLFWLVSRLQEETVTVLALDMDTKEISPGVRMPVMSIGCGGLESKKAREIVASWIKLGGTGIDTALNYGNQEEVRRAIADSGVARENLLITTKLPDCNVTNTKNYIDADLELLNTTYLDLLLIHGPRNGDCGETWRIVEDHYRSNQTRAIGVSNFGREDLEPILQQSSIFPHVNQIKLNLLQKDWETIRYCTRHSIAVEAYTPLAKGRVAHNQPEIQAIAHNHNISAYQVALKWVLQHGWILTFQSSSIVHQASDADVFGFELSDEEMKVLDKLNGTLGDSVIY